jgi:D-psicose/D-tagatose/L-ribulose 3-epimerase
LKKLNFSISNLAWNVREETEVIKVLENSALTGVEISLSKYFQDIENIDMNHLLQLKDRWLNIGLKITSLQSLLYKKANFKLFADTSTRLLINNYLNHLYRMAVELEVKPLVFGSPRNRIKGSLSYDNAFEIAGKFFGDVIASWDPEGPFLALESNPPLYGCDFIVNNVEAINLVKSVDSPNFRWHLDYGCALLSGENPNNLISNNYFLPSHIHLSEKNLKPISRDNFDNYLEFLYVLNLRNYAGIVTFEMLPNEDMTSFRKSIDLINSIIEKTNSNVF